MADQSHKKQGQLQLSRTIFYAETAANEYNQLLDTRI